MAAAASAAHDVLAGFAHAYASPFDEARAFKRKGGRVIGYMSANAPVELVEAAGMLALRVDGGGLTATPRTDAFMESLFDPSVRGVCELLLSGALDFLDAIILPRTTDSVQRLYYYLCEQERAGAAKLPRLILFDLLHTPFYSSAEHSYESLLKVRDAFAALSGAPIADAAIQQAIEESNKRQAILAACARQLTGSSRLHLFAAAQRMPCAGFLQAAAGLSELLAGVAQPATKRVVIAGNGPDTDDIHNAIADAGAVVVGDFHDRGELSFGLPIDTTLPPLRAISAHYQRGTVSARTFPSRPEALVSFARECRADAVLFFFYAEEEVLTWDYPGQRDHLAAAGVPSACLSAQSYDVDRAGIASAVVELFGARA